MLMAPIDRRREAELRDLLASMNHGPGRVDPNNALVPFGRYDALHFSRFLILDDATLGDAALYGVPPLDPPLQLVFLLEVDGDAGAFVQAARARVRARAARDLRVLRGLRRERRSCGLDAGAQPARLGRVHQHRGPHDGPRARRRRAVRRARTSPRRERGGARRPARGGRARRAARVRERREGAPGASRSRRSAPTPPGWALRKLLNLIGVPLLLLIFAVPLAFAAIVLLLRIRMLEATDPQYCPRPDPQHVALLASLEDHDVTNQFSAMGMIKPGFVRRTTCVAILFLLNFVQRHIFTRGRLARVRTIHFARWTFVDDENRRLLFTSNYDGSLDSYMDDFINKVAFGLNLVFSNGIGYPSSRWLVAGGAKDEQPYKNYIRRHELPTEVWYNGHPGLTANDLQRNALVRAGIDTASMSEPQAREWLALL